MSRTIQLKRYTECVQILTELVRRKEYDLLLKVVKKECTPNVILENGESLLTTLLQDNFEYGKILLDEYGANINILNRRSETPLFTAIKRKDLKLAEYLLSKGARPEVQDVENQTVYCLADENKAILELLDKYPDNVLNTTEFKLTTAKRKYVNSRSRERLTSSSPKRKCQEDIPVKSNLAKIAIEYACKFVNKPIDVSVELWFSKLNEVKQYVDLLYPYLGTVECTVLLCLIILRLYVYGGLRVNLEQCTFRMDRGNFIVGLYRKDRNCLAGTFFIFAILEELELTDGVTMCLLEDHVLLKIGDEEYGTMLETIFPEAPFRNDKGDILFKVWLLSDKLNLYFGEETWISKREDNECRNVNAYQHLLKEMKTQTVWGSYRR